MPVEADSQDSRDPNSPQWGYVKVQNPEDGLQYPAKDDNWNEYVMFVHDQQVIPIEGFDPKQGKVPARTKLECVMVPASLTIGSHKQLKQQITSAINSCNPADQRTLNELNKTLAYLEEKEFDEISIPSRQKQEKNASDDGTLIPDRTTLWVALVVGSK